ncbi:MAG TPA: phenylalanine--tRNA ligase subunit alpha [Thermoanaerobaculia bacterium]|nr:phenylalanine--tRNA ligase subunit alpha [Thermoanaerobaculia bacterium]
MRTAQEKAATSGLLPAEVRALHVKWLGQQQGAITALLKQLRDVPKDQKAAAGAAVNSLKKEAEAALSSLEESSVLFERVQKQKALAVDVTLPPRVPRLGRLHPLTVVRRRMEEAFFALGYEVAHGPEVESDWHNFESLNFPPDHPARDAVDTFFVKDGGEGRDRLLLRTHTSPVQIRTMRSQKPPIRIVIPGRVYRKDDIDPRHSPVFHQMEGLTVGEGITFADLKGTLAAFSRRLFSPETKIRFGPTFFPFVEPGVDVAVSCVFCRGTGAANGASCRPCSGSGWIEIMGAGMVHPNVLRNGGIDPEKFSGFAFGMGIDRIAFLLHGVPDLRLFFENDVRFLDRVWA